VTCFQRSWPLAALSLLLACDGGKEKGDAKKTADAKPAADATPADDAKPVEAAKPAEAAKPHFDVTKDHSGVLARSAAVLEATERFDDENLHEISHHAEKLPTYEKVCTHEAGIEGEGFDQPGCVKAMEHHMVQLGPELYQQLADCMLSAKTGEQIDACHAAEAEAEAKLHANPHGDGLSEDVCDELFEHFETLAMDDAKEQAELVKEILEEVRADVVLTCTEQGTQAEVDCSMKAKTMPELKECASKLL